MIEKLRSESLRRWEVVSELCFYSLSRRENCSEAFLFLLQMCIPLSFIVQVNKEKGVSSLALILGALNMKSRILSRSSPLKVLSSTPPQPLTPTGSLDLVIVMAKTLG